MKSVNDVESVSSVQGGPVDHDMDCKEFTKFPKLPAELRLKIWRYAFPDPQCIVIDDKFALKDEFTKRVQWNQRKIPLPITLHICSESRQETLRHYCLTWWRDVNVEHESWLQGIEEERESWLRHSNFELESWWEEKGIPFAKYRNRDFRRPICFDPKRDTVAINPKWLAFDFEDLFQSGCGQQLKQLRTLEISYSARRSKLLLLRPGYSMGCALHILQSRITGKVPPFLRNWLDYPTLGSLFDLVGLKHIIFTLREAEDEVVVEEHRNAIMTFLEKNKDKFKDGKIPHIVVRKERD